MVGVGGGGAGGEKGGGGGGGGVLDYSYFEIPNLYLDSLTFVVVRLLRLDG